MERSSLAIVQIICCRVFLDAVAIKAMSLCQIQDFLASLIFPNSFLKVSPLSNDHIKNKTLCRTLDPRANGAWLIKLTELNIPLS